MSNDEVTENLRHLSSFRVEGLAGRSFSQWNGWAMRSRLEPIKAVARMIDRRLDNIITHCCHLHASSTRKWLRKCHRPD